MQNVSIVGFGKVGGAMAIALSRAGRKITAVSGRDLSPSHPALEAIEPRPEVFGVKEFDPGDSRVVLITVRDDQIRATAEDLAARIDPRGIVFLHTSGSRGSDVLAAIAEAGGETGSIHPLVSISDPVLGSERFSGTYFCIEGTDAAVAAATSIAGELQGKPFTIPSDKKPLYHAAAVMACGHVLALFDEAAESLARCGPDAREARNILLPLVLSTIENLSVQSPERAITGTFARGDLETFESHLEALKTSVPPEVIETYLLLGERSLDLAERQGTPPELIRALREAIGRERGGK